MTVGKKESFILLTLNFIYFLFSFHSGRFEVSSPSGNGVRVGDIIFDLSSSCNDVWFFTRNNFKLDYPDGEEEMKIYDTIHRFVEHSSLIS